MNARYQVNGWLQELARNAPPMTLDASGRCFMLADEELGMALFVPSAGRDFYLYSDLMPAPNRMSPEFYESALALNAATDVSGGLAVAFEPRSRHLIAMLQRDTTALDAIGFSNLLQNMKSRVLVLREKLTTAHGPEPGNGISDLFMHQRH